MGSKIITDVDFAHDLTDMSFADDTTLISEDKANEFVPRVGSAAASVGIHKKGKIRVTTLNMEDRSSDLRSRSGEAIGR